MRLVTVFLTFWITFALGSSLVPSFEPPKIVVNAVPNIEAVKTYTIDLLRVVGNDVVEVSKDEIQRLQVVFFRPLLEVITHMENPSQVLSLVFETHYQIFGMSLSSSERLMQFFNDISSTTDDPLFTALLLSLTQKFDLMEEKNILSGSLDGFIQPKGCGYSHPNEKEMMGLIADFLANPNHYEAMVQEMFPVFESFGEALNFSINQLALHQEMLYKIRSELEQAPLQMFSTKLLRGAATIAVYNSFFNIALSNGILRFVVQSRSSGDKKYAEIASQVLGTFLEGERKMIGLPLHVDREFYDRIVPHLAAPQRSFLLVLLVQLTAKTDRSKELPESWTMSIPLAMKVTYQIIFALEPFIDNSGKHEEAAQFFELWEMFQKELKLSSLEDPKHFTKNEVFKKMLTKTLSFKETAAYSKPNFKPLLPLDKKVIFSALTNQQIDRDVFFDFEEVEEVEERLVNPNELSKKGNQGKRKHNKNAKKKKQKKKIAASVGNSSKSAIDQKDDSVALPAQPERIFDECEKESVISSISNASSESIAEQIQASELVSPEIGDAVLESMESGKGVVQEPLIYEEVQNGKAIEEQEDIEELLQQHRETYERYNQLKKLKLEPEFFVDEFNVIKEGNIPRKSRHVVAMFSTENWRKIHVEANRAYAKNQLDATANLVNSRCKTLKFRWVLNPEIVIGLETYKFLCRLFNLSKGKNTLTFDNFLKTFMDLNPSKKKLIQMSMYKKKAQRTVFQFEHVVQSNGVTYVPPIGGAHCEHRSSRFNHKQIHDFFMHAGAHPYFFVLVEN